MSIIIVLTFVLLQVIPVKVTLKLEMWANAQRDGRPAEYRFNAAVWLCSNAAKTRNPLKFVGVPQTNETISAASGPKFTILWGHLEDILLLKAKFHYTSWFGASSEQARVMEFGF